MRIPHVRRGLAVAAASGLVLLGGAEAPRHATGASPVDHAVYARLPKLQRHRAWLPQAVDLADMFPAPGDQGIQSDCVEWATVYAARSYLHSKDIGRRPAQPAELASPAYVYNRLRPPGSSCHIPTQMIDALNLLKTEGVVSVADFPDDWRKCEAPAPGELKSRAGALKIDDWRAVDRETPNDWRTPLVLDDVKGALARGAPVVFAMPISDDFEHWKGGGVYHYDGVPTQNWHAMALVGYDETRQAFRLINSWGQAWGDHGYGWIDYATFQRMAGEAYAMEPSAAARVPRIGVQSNAPPIDRVRMIAAGLPCAEVVVREEAGHPIVEGFAGAGEAVDSARAAVLAIDPGAQWRVASHPWPQCEAETTLSAQLHDTKVTLAAVTEAGGARGGDPVVLKEGERFGIVADAPADKPYLEIIYLQADGSAVELYRGEPVPGAGGMGHVALGVSGSRQARFEVQAPLGDEILIALASAQPLFGPELKSDVTERQFLTALRAHLVAAPRGSVSSAVLRLKSRV